ncbi:MAG: hypothetical protein KJS83_01870 [Xanthomonadaceae bacterium]|nr:hypothetical protein [Xanthomonadaceae bacterium]MBU6477086.1 hypothetical protein [Xanthomonadaceae bacterium]MDE2054031.1 hypothetical protein [Xanthomonadaceae bacterium]MDE2225156.1 hypothetical protein [Xanthomonadaceae bacterium]
MHPFPLVDLVWPTIFILVAGFAIAYAFTRRIILSYWITALKAGLFLLYFGFVFDGTYTFLDDWRYLDIGEQLAANGIGLMNIISHYQYIVSTVAGENIAYYVYNATAVNMFGAGYYAPITINIVLTFLEAGLLMKAARTGLGMGRRAAIGLFAFVALGPDILVWSTIPNFKDTLVATGTAAAVYAVALVDKHRIGRAALLAIAAAFVLAITRLYVPLMLGVAFGITLFLSPHGRRNPWLWLLATVALFVVVRHIGHGSLVDAVRELRSEMDNPVKGVVRFLVTPIPFHTAPGYGFMNLPQMIYWTLLPFMFYGLRCVWRKATVSSRFVVIYFILMVLLYGSFTTLQGARHRVQIDGLVVVFQFYGLLALFRQRFRQHVRYTPGASPDAIPADDVDASPDAGGGERRPYRVTARAGDAR